MAWIFKSSRISINNRVLAFLAWNVRATALVDFDMTLRAKSVGTRVLFNKAKSAIGVTTDPLNRYQHALMRWSV